MRRYFSPSAYSLCAFAFLSLAVNAEVSEGFLERIKELGAKPSETQVIEFGEFMRKEEHRMSLEERGRADRMFSYALGTFPPEDVPPMLRRLEGVRSAALVRIAIEVVNRSEGNEDATKYLNSTPEGIVDYFLVSSHGTKQNGDLLLDLKERAVAIVLSELERSGTPSRSRLRMIGLIMQVVVERRDDLNEEFISETFSSLRKHVDLLDSGDRKIAESYLQRIGKTEEIRDIREEGASEGLRMDSITSELGSQPSHSQKEERKEMPRFPGIPVFICAIFLLVIFVVLAAIRIRSRARGVGGDP